MLAIFAALGANVLVAISKFIGFFFSGSVAMLNESIHSIVDCANEVLLIVGDKRAKTDQSALHPFGEGRAKYFFSMIVATMLFFGGGAYGTMEAIQKIGHPNHVVEGHGLVIGILIFGMIVEGFSLRVAFKEIRELNKRKLPLFRFLQESRHSEILIIFTEDSCAVVGLLIALVGTIFSMVTGNPVFDAISGLLIGLLLMIAAFFLAREFYSLIVGESVTDSDLEIILKAFQTDEVEKLIDLKTLHIGPEEILIAAKIDLLDSVEDKGYLIINRIEEDIRGSLPELKCRIYIEIDKYDLNYQR